MGGYGVNNHTKMKSTSNMRGQLGTKSGPLAPTSAKLTTQYLVLDHMTNHYSKITKAKPAIDNKPPRSINQSQKSRDRKTQDHIKKTGQRPASAAGRISRPHTTTGYYHDEMYDEDQWGEPDDEEEALVNSIMRTTLRKPVDMGGAYDAYAHQRPPPRQRPSSARSQRSVGSNVSRTMVQVPSQKSTYDGDLLAKRSHVFTEEKPFTPRTLKTDRKSRLSQYKYYNKPPPKGEVKSQRNAAEAEAPQVEQNSEGKVKGNNAKPVPQPRSSMRLDRTREGPVTMNSLMFETLHSRDFSNDQKNPDVPKLDISMDTDHLKWIKEQASKAQVRANSETLKSTTLQEEGEFDTTVDYGKTGEMSLTYGTLGSTKTRPNFTSEKMSQEYYLVTAWSDAADNFGKYSGKRDEDSQYVKFMGDVTNDIIHRGIYTDRAVRQVFKTHIARNRGKLDEVRMNQITDDIRNQLNIPRYDINDDTSYTMNEPSHQPITTSYNEENLKPHGVNRFEVTAEIHNELEMNGTMDTTVKSKASKGSTEQSADTYNFKSTEDDDLYSTIRSDANNTVNLTDTQTLKTYQNSIKEMDEGEEQESTVGTQNGFHDRENDNKDGDDEYDDDYDDDDDDGIYEDEGDDEEEDDVQQATDPTATYRTDDDDF